MALLGTFVDKTSGRSFTGAGALTTQSHSLGTTPDAVIIQLRSQAGGSIVTMLAEGANASLATVGTAGATTSHCDILIIYYMSITR